MQMLYENNLDSRGEVQSSKEWDNLERISFA